MDDWRRNRSENYNNNNYYYNNNNYNYQPVSRNFKGSDYRKPPPQQAGSWQQPSVPSWEPAQPNVPSWEKKFVTSVGRIPWGRLVHAHKDLYLYKDVLQWDDSAGEEAFHNAKARYWAAINRLPCENSIPNPDMYIDEIDWNAEVDYQLYLDLEKVPEFSGVETKDVNADKVVNTNNYRDQPIVPTGWGDDDTDVQDGDKNASNKNNPWTVQYGKTNTSTWDDVPWGLNSLMKPIITPGDDNQSRTSNKLSPPLDQPIVPSGWGGDEPNLQGGDKKGINKDNPWESSCGGWEAVPWGSNTLTNKACNQFENLTNSWGSGNQRRENDNWRKRESDGQHMSRYKTTRFQGDYYQTNNGWRSNRGKKRVTFAHEQSPMEPWAPQQWNSIHT